MAFTEKKFSDPSKIPIQPERGSPGGSNGKESTCKAGNLGFVVGKIFWRREWLLTSVFLPGEFYGERSLLGYSPRGHKESDTAEQLTLFFSLWKTALWTDFLQGAYTRSKLVQCFLYQEILIIKKWNKTVSADQDSVCNELLCVLPRLLIYLQSRNIQFSLGISLWVVKSVLKISKPDSKIKCIL